MLSDISQRRAERWMKKALSNEGKWVHMSRKNENGAERDKVFNELMKTFDLIGVRVQHHHKTPFKFKVLP